MKKRAIMKREYVRKLQLRLLLIWGCVVLLHFLLGSCTMEEVEEDTQKAGTETDATFFLNPPVMQNLVFSENEPTKAEAGAAALDADSIDTKSFAELTDELEKKINTLWVGQFGSDGSLLYSKYYPAEVADKVELRLKVTTAACTIYFVANATELSTFGGNKAAFEALTLDHITNTDGHPSLQRCVMIGSWTGFAGRGGVTGEVEMTRLVAKVTLDYSFGGTGFTFTVTGVKMHNVPKKYQLIEPAGQLPDVPYREGEEVFFDWGSPANTPATRYWYIPENKAGIATGPAAVQSVRDKIGTGVNRPVYIELLGNATQGNVTYNNVSFRLYPGGTNPADNNMNNYIVRRNCHYTIKLRLVGIDLSDKRVTVGEIPSITNPDYMAPEIGSTKSVQITARPGQNWSLQLPAWLSATISGRVFSAGENISSEGPALVEFKAATANPDEQPRAHEFTLRIPDDKRFTIGQNPSSLSMRLSTDVTQNLAPGAATGTCFVTATAGLPFSGLVRHDGGEWVSLTGDYRNQIATGREQIFGYSIAPNPSGKDWRGSAIQVQAGNIIKEIDFIQFDSGLKVSDENVISAAGVPAINSTFQTSKGLNWQLTHNMPWITLHTPTSGVVDSYDVQLIGYSVAPNSTRSSREGNITVRVGNGIDKGDANLQKNIKVRQAGAVLNVYTNAPSPLPAAAADNIGYGYVFWDVPAGLNYAVSSDVDWITVGGTITGTTHDGEHHFSVQVNSTNPNSTPRTGHVKAKVGDMEASVDITQAGSSFGLYTGGITGGYYDYIDFDGIANLRFNETRYPVNVLSITKYNLAVRCTSGLTWGIRKESGDAAFSASVDGTNQTEVEATGGYQPLSIYVSGTNTGTQPRSAVFTVYAKEGNGNLDKTITITQEGRPNNVIWIDQAVMDACMTRIGVNNKIPIFNYDGEKDSGTYGTDIHGNSSTHQLETPYLIEVSRTSTGLDGGRKCDTGLGYRTPTFIELFSLWWYTKGTNDDASDEEAASYLFGDKMLRYTHASSSVYGINSKGATRCKFVMKTGKVNPESGIATAHRCIREVKIE